MLVIALTGGIGSGKTTVSDIFKSKNIPIIDTDIIARQIVEKDKPAYNEIIKKFGQEILNKDKDKDKDKEISRSTLRKLVFSSAEKRLQLESILHPIIWDEVRTQLSRISSDIAITSSYCIVVVPLLLENSPQPKAVTFDRILVVDVPEDVQIKRAKIRDNCDETIVKNIMKNQISRLTRVNAADDIILNTESLDSLKDQINKLHQQYSKLAK